MVPGGPLDERSRTIAWVQASTESRRVRVWLGVGGRAKEEEAQSKRSRVESLEDGIVARLGLVVRATSESI